VQALLSSFSTVALTFKSARRASDGLLGFFRLPLRRVADPLTVGTILGAAPLWFSRVRVLTFLLFHLPLGALLSIPAFTAALQVFRRRDHQHALHALPEIRTEMADIAGYQMRGLRLDRRQQNGRVLLRQRDPGGSSRSRTSKTCSAAVSRASLRRCASSSKLRFASSMA